MSKLYLGHYSFYQFHHSSFLCERTNSNTLTERTYNHLVYKSLQIITHVSVLTNRIISNNKHTHRVSLFYQNSHRRCYLCYVQQPWSIHYRTVMRKLTQKIVVWIWEGVFSQKKCSRSFLEWKKVGLIVTHKCGVIREAPYM